MWVQKFSTNRLVYVPQPFGVTVLSTYHSSRSKFSMSTLVQRGWKHIVTLSIMVVMIFLVAQPSYADKCGSDDRVPLPSCAVEDYLGEQSGVRVTNNCPGKITVKWDIDGADDDRFTIPRNSYATGGVGKASKVRGVYCCPRYNECIF